MTISFVYGGYCYFPEHPLADMHGIVRFCVRTPGPLHARDQLTKYGVNLFSVHSHFWGESKSHVEQEVTARDFAEVYWCRPALAYTQPPCYSKDRSLLLSVRQETSRLAHAEGSKVRASGRSGRKVEFP